MIKKLVPDPPHTCEETLLRISDVLRCAAAIAYESADQQSGTKRALPHAALYLIDMAKALADELLNQIDAHRPG